MHLAAAKHGTSPPQKDEDMSLHLRGAGPATPALRLEEIGKLPYATEDEQLKLKAAFDKADKDASGEIDIRELGSVAASLGKELRTHELEMMMKQADADGSGTVDFQEFCALMGVRIELADADEEVLQEVFKVFDKDGSGYIERHELHAMFASLSTNSFRVPPDTMVDEMIKDADMDGDGRINYAEFVKVMLQRPDWG